MLGIKYKLQQTCKNIAKARKGEGMAFMYDITHRQKSKQGVRTTKRTRLRTRMAKTTQERKIKLLQRKAF